MVATYDKKRKDITFCTMLFKIPCEDDFASLKRMDRKFENFYLPSLKRLIETFERVALWCDPQTAQYLKQHKLDKKILMRVMDFSELPHYQERAEWNKILNDMKRHRGYLLHKKTPKQWLDYMILINAKPSVLNWAATENKFKTEYFMWLDAGSFNDVYARMWMNWTGRIDAKPQNRVRITIAPTLGRVRPALVPQFLYRLYKKFCKPIPDATREALIKQNLINIAMIDADYDVPACSMIMQKDMAHKFYNFYEQTRLILKRHNLVTTEQAVFQAMMKLDTIKMFELSYICGYTGVYAAVARKRPDYMLD